jgi:hypothetical protein
LYSSAKGTKKKAKQEKELGKAGMCQKKKERKQRKKK